MDLDTGLHYPIEIKTLPESWVVGFMETFADEVESGFACGKHNSEGEGLIHLRPMNVSRNGVLDLSDFRSVPSDFNEKRLSEGDVLFNNTNSPELIGKTAHVTKTYAGLAFSNHMTRIKFHPGVIPTYAAIQLHYLWSMKYYLHRCVKHVNQASISTKDMARTIPFVLPPLNEQKRIVAKIEELFSELDNGIAALKSARKKLKLYRQAVLKHAFEGKLTAHWREDTNSPKWNSCKLGKYLSFITSGSRGWAKYYADSGDIFIRAQNLKYDRLDLDEKAFVSLPKKAEGKRTQVYVDDVLVTITGANVTKTGVVTNDIGTAYVSQHVALCRPTEHLNSEFLYWFLVAEAAGRRQLSDFAYGAGKPGLNLDNIKSIEVKVPEIKEQKVIVEKIRELLSIEENIARSLDSELTRVELLRQSILKKAFSGQLVPQDPSDEPASELLARIQAEKAAQQAAAKPARKSTASKRGRKARKVCA